MTKRVLTLAFLATLAASTAFAYVPPREVVSRDRPRASREEEIGTPMGPPIRNVVPGPNTDSGPAHPVPEPGTIALASMGLMALGAHMRRRRGN